MKALDLSRVRDSLAFWPAVGFSAIGVFFFGWAARIWTQDWVGQAIWGVLATVIAVSLLLMAIRESHRTGAQTRHSPAGGR